MHDRGLFLGRPGRAAQDDGNHAFLGGALDRVDAEVGRGIDQAGAVVPAVGAGAKFGEGVEDVFRLRPAQRPEAAELGAGIVRKPPCRRHGNGERGNGGCDPNSPQPQPPDLPAAQFLRHHADRPRPLAGTAGLRRRGVAAEVKFSIEGHDVAERQALSMAWRKWSSMAATRRANA